MQVLIRMTYMFYPCFLLVVKLYLRKGAYLLHRSESL